jgi:uncharacterized membrane protein HdeD (DUF308 family)
MSTMDESTAIRSGPRAGLARLAGPWWIFLLTGIAWLILAWIALRFAPASIPTVGVLLGVYFLVAAFNEFFLASIMPSWRWLHILMGIIFAFGAGWSFAQPYNAFWALASILGLLLIFQGTFYIITSVSTREVNSMWWLGLATGILEVLLGFWASQQYRPVQGALLLIWVGFFALFRGISEIVIAFQLRHAEHA